MHSLNYTEITALSMIYIHLIRCCMHRGPHEVFYITLDILTGDLLYSLIRFACFRQSQLLDFHSYWILVVTHAQFWILILSTSNWLITDEYSSRIFRTDHIENSYVIATTVVWRRVYQLPSNSCRMAFFVVRCHSLVVRGVYWVLRSDGRSGGMWCHSLKRRVHVTPTSCCAIHVTIWTWIVIWY
jgi:hypothetical protein